MRYLVVSDLHSNTEALEAVLEDAGGRGYDAIVCLGDLVGYGAEPNEVLERLRGLEPECVIRGNHDKVVGGLDSGEQFNQAAGQSVDWTRTVLRPDNLKYLKELPVGPRAVADSFWVAHGTPLDEDAYILNEFDALEVFAHFSENICFFGHSHLPIIFSLSEAEGLVLMAPMADEVRLNLKPEHRYLINAGSVGQPRDRNPKAAYAIMDLGCRVVELYRVAYPLEVTQRKILEAGLPMFLAERLTFGV